MDSSVVRAFVGLDVHKETISVAVADAGQRGRGEVRFWGTIENTPAKVRLLAKKLAVKHGILEFCYEAGPCGYGLYRDLVDLSHRCTRSLRRLAFLGSPVIA